jgi:hypothetical protein
MVVADATLDEYRKADSEVHKMRWSAFGEKRLRDAKEIAELLMTAGASPMSHDDDGRTPLHLAIFCGRIKMTETLLAAAPIEVVRNTMVLHLAAFSGFSGLVEVLLEAGVSSTIEDHFGNTPLHWAAKGASAESMKALLSAGADVNAKNTEGATPLHFAAAGREGEVRQVIDKVYVRKPVTISGFIEGVKVLLNAGASAIAEDENEIMPVIIATHVPKEVPTEQQGPCRVCQTMTALKCTGCWKLYYCSREHLRQDWKARHKKECKGKAISK